MPTPLSAIQSFIEGPRRSEYAHARDFEYSRLQDSLNFLNPQTPYISHLYFENEKQVNACCCSVECTRGPGIHSDVYQYRDEWYVTNLHFVWRSLH